MWRFCSSSSPQDVTLYYDGDGDLNETYPVGRIDEDSERLIRTARKCLDESIKVCKSGALIRDIGKVMWVYDWNLMRLRN